MATHGLTYEELRRYGRHLVMPEVTLEGQQVLKSASVLIVGAGGLGSPAMLYLSAAGVGKIGLVDFDTVDFSNLQRQIIYGTEDVGKKKLDIARERISALNPHVEVESFETQLSSANALKILAPFDVIIDGTDNFPTRYLVNDACVLLGKPNVYGSIFRFEGQVSVFDARNGPCYRCLYPEPPPPGLVLSCAEGGVLGVVPGIIGSLQAAEALKLILGIGEGLIGRLLLFDALKMQFREVKLKKIRHCPICGDHPTIKELIDYEEFPTGPSRSDDCGTRVQPDHTRELSEDEISVQEVRERLECDDGIILLDVRERHEIRIAQIGGCHIPLGELLGRVHELDSSQLVAVLCHYGIRSKQAVEFLKQLGFKKVRNIVGGIDKWSQEIDPTVPRY